MNTQRNREWRLIRRPTDAPQAGDVELVEVALPPRRPGEVRVRNLVMSVEPYMWGRMTGGASYAEPYELGATMLGHAVGVVVETDDPGLGAGDLVLHELGWREYAQTDAANVRRLTQPDLSPASWLGVMGLTGLTAYVGLLDIARCRPGDTVFVSAAAGAVGSTAAQIAKSMGCTVIGSAGSAQKVEFLLDGLGLDAAFSHRDGPIRASLAQALEQAGQDGIDVYFDNVGGEQLEAAIRCMREFGRIALCGAISTYGGPAVGPKNLLLAIWRRLRLEGFLAGDHEARRPEFERVMGTWLRTGAVRSVESVQEGGIEQAFAVMLGMLQGAHLGKTVVQLSPLLAP